MYLKMYRNSRYIINKLNDRVVKQKPLHVTSSFLPKRTFSHSTEDGEKETHENKNSTGVGGFAKAYEKFGTQEPVQEKKDPSFLSLLKHSKFIDLGDPEGKVVTGTIFQVVDDDLYVDFGWKFHCVVSRPAKNGHEYITGAKVKLIVKDLELSTRFLGSKKDLTLLEADATLIGLVSSPARSSSRTSS